MEKFEKLLLKLRVFRQERDWEKFHKPKEVAMAAAIEAAELMEIFLWKNEEEIKRFIAKNRETVADEIADTAVYLMLLADDLGIDLLDAIEAKMKKNAEKYPVEKCKGRYEKYSEL